MKAINLQEKFDKFSDQWSPKIIAETNGQHVRLTKLVGEYVWHSHADEDELFIVIKGTLTVHFREETVEVKAGELLVIPKGVEHMPTAQEEVYLMNITKKEAKTTGDIEADITVKLADLEWI